MDGRGAGYSPVVPVHRTDDRTLIAGRYDRGERLGHGGFGVVWRAHDTLLQRDVAVKEIHFPLSLDADEQAALRDKVLREARAAARMSHPGFVTVFDVVEEEGHPLIVMELVDAPTLSEFVLREGPLSDAEAAEVGGQVLEALTVAHAHGIVHRDVKPANVMVHQSGRVQLADFGVASMLDDPKVTGSGELAGSPAYMSPEQAQNRPASPATDLWGLGATLYYAVEGLPPYDKGSALSTLTSVVNDPPRPMRRAGALRPLVEDLLNKEPTARPPVEEVCRRLADVADADVPAAPTDRDPTENLHLTMPVATANEPGRAPVAPSPSWPAPSEPAPSEPAPSERAASNPAPGSPPAIPAAPPDWHAAGPAAPSRQPPPAPPPAPSRQPDVRRRGTQTQRRRRNLAPLAVLVLILAVLGGLIAVLAARDDDPDGGSRATGTGIGSTATTVSTDGKVPANWVRYRDPDTGFTIAHPPGWTVTRSGTLTDIRDPVSRAYMRIDHQQPPNPSPEGAWQSFEPRFAAQYANYQRVQITPTTFKGYRAAIWEFTYSDGGADLHAVDLGFIAGKYGFALNWQTRAADWDRMKPMFEQFKESFKAPS